MGSRIPPAHILAVLAWAWVSLGQVQAAPEPLVIPAQGNSWYASADARTDRRILERGIDNWSDLAKPIHTYFWVPNPGTIHISVRARVSTGPSTLRLTLGDTSRTLSLTNTVISRQPVGRFVVPKPGYQRLEVRGLKKSGDAIADIQGFLVSGMPGIRFVRDAFYWSRRGPSVHLKYSIPDGVGDIRYFYSEIRVPKGQDVMGSYFMATGFAEGYFGMQVNGPTERRILFSVWSPFKTDDPKKIPPDHRVQLLKKGAQVNTGKFGNEGSGGQCYKKYIWKSGVDYRFLLKGEPTGTGETDYTAYFFAPEIGHWSLIASFRRPKTNTHLTRLHSFLENFLTHTGNRSRLALYGNQWVYDRKGRWHPLRRAQLTGDDTARKKYRLDFDGGIRDGGFFLRNCGFFTAKTPLGLRLERGAAGPEPQIDFSKLP